MFLQRKHITAMGWPKVSSLATSCKKRNYFCKLQKNSGTHCKDAILGNKRTTSMWFKKKIPLQSDILIFYLYWTFFFSAPEITILVDNTTGVTSQSIYVEWKVCFCQK